MYALSVTNHIPANFFTDNAMKFSTLTEFFFLTLGLHRLIKRNHRKQAEYKATYKIAEMFGHDVMKPFEMMRKFLKRTTEIGEREIPFYIAKNAGHIQESIKAAEEMLLDLKEIGRSERPIGETQIGVVIEKNCNGRYEKDLQFTGHVQISEVQLTRVLVNIVRNAQEAVSGVPDTEHWVRTKEKGDFVHLTIGNTGSSIPYDILHRVFDFRFTSGKRHGNGIGLNVVERAVTMSRGEVWVESNGYSSRGRSTKKARPGEYVEFHILLLKGGVHES